jgi:tartrate dehydratase beta subunit/fumarate hydratase class I family protein
LGTEAIFRLKLDRFPVIVINDAYGNDFYRQVQGNRPGKV